MKKYTLLFTLIAVLASCNNSGGSKTTENTSGVEDKVAGTYTTGGVTRTYKLDGTVDSESPYGNKTYTWKVIEENSQFIKIEETQGDSKGIFYIFDNSTKYPSKISSCINDSRSSKMKNYTGAILIGQYALDSSEGCNGVYFKGSIE